MLTLKNKKRTTGASPQLSVVFQKQKRHWSTVVFVINGKFGCLLKLKYLILHSVRFMDYIEQIKTIRSLLSSRGYQFLTDDIISVQLSSGTGGEMLISVCSRLLGIKNKYPEAYAFIKADADKLISYCNSIGLHPIPSNPS